MTYEGEMESDARSCFRTSHFRPPPSSFHSALFSLPSISDRGGFGGGSPSELLFLLVQVVQLHYLWGTVLAVECALIHNFCWHLCWTWRNRPSLGVRELCHRLARFDCANGLVSMVGNAAVMRVLVGELHLPGLSAGGIAIVSCCLVNFVLGDRFVFRPLG